MAEMRVFYPFPAEQNAQIRHVGHCTARCTLEAGTYTSNHVPAGAAVKHNGQWIELDLGDLTDVAYDAWDDLRTQWASKASDLHREEVMQSDWPVF